MKLRTARKIIKAVGTSDERRYRDDQIGAASARVERTRTAKEDERFYRDLMDSLGVEGRVELLFALGEYEKAMDLLMRHGA